MPKSSLKERLKPYGLDETGKLAYEIGVFKQQASRWLAGKPYSVGTAKLIAKHIGLSWQEVYSWQDGNS